MLYDRSCLAPHVDSVSSSLVGSPKLRPLTPPLAGRTLFKNQVPLLGALGGSRERGDPCRTEGSCHIVNAAGGGAVGNVEVNFLAGQAAGTVGKWADAEERTKPCPLPLCPAVAMELLESPWEGLVS